MNKGTNCLYCQIASFVAMPVARYCKHEKMGEVLELVLGQLKSNKGIDWQRIYSDLNTRDVK